MVGRPAGADGSRSSGRGQARVPMWQRRVRGAGATAGRAAAANTRATQVRVREGSNTRATRTKRHSPAHLGTGVKIDASAQLPG